MHKKYRNFLLPRKQAKKMMKSSSLQSFSEKSSSCSENIFSQSPETAFFFINNPNSMLQETENVKHKKKNKKKKVFLERYEDVYEEDELCRSRSLTDDDLEELKGCLDLGFGFNYDEIPELCNTFPALELCYSMSQKYHDEQNKGHDSICDATSSASSSKIPNWKISSPGDDPEDVKARLKYWAQAVACTMKLCS